MSLRKDLSIAEILNWAWVNGLNVKLESRSTEIPALKQLRYPPRDAPDFETPDRFIADMPVITFYNPLDGRSIQIEGRNWLELASAINRAQKHIFAELRIQLYRIDTDEKKLVFGR